MMNYEFSAHCHSNITARHKTTLEFTKDSELSEKGDCIIGIKADFELEELKRFMNFDRIRIKITATELTGLTEEITAVPNPDFSSNYELVIRKTDFTSKRTFAVKADKAAADMNREFADALKSNGRIRIHIENI